MAKSEIAKQISSVFEKKLSAHTHNKVDRKCTESRPKVDLNHTETRPKLHLEKQETRPKVDRKRDLNVDLKYTESVPKVDLNVVFSSLTGKELEMVYFIYTECLNNGGVTTEKLSISYIKSKINSSEIALKRTIQRIFKKGVLLKEFTKNGRGGWTVYKLPKAIYSQILQSESRPKVDLNYTETRPKVDRKRYLKLDLSTPSSSSSSSNINKELTTSEDDYHDPSKTKGQQTLSPEFDPEWQAIDITPLDQIGFTKTHLSQLFIQGNILAKEMQESIYAFAFDLDHNNKTEKIKKTPLIFFLGIMKKVGFYVPPENYESEGDRLSREKEEYMVAQQKKRKEQESRIKELTYDEWVSKLTKNKRLEILDVDISFYDKMPSQAVKKMLREYFDVKVYDGNNGSV